MKLKSQYVRAFFILITLLSMLLIVSAFQSNEDGDVLGTTDKEIASTSALTDDFIITIQSDNPGTSSNTQFIIPTTGGGYDYNVDCDDDGIDEATAQTGSYTCNYPEPDFYTIRIEDNTGFLTGFPRIQFNNSGDKDKLISIDQWGAGEWDTMYAAFSGCTNLNGTASDTPDITNMDDVSYMFMGATSFNGDISTWDVSSIGDMTSMFEGAISFNQDLNSWEVSNVYSMSDMFSGATSFNGNISAWDVSYVEDMYNMFSGATSFNQAIVGWDTSFVYDISYMFSGATSFNQDISGWIVGDISDMVGTFEGATSFNQNISSWDVASTMDMSYMFSGATSFDQNIGGWDISGVEDMTDMFDGVTLSQVNYDSILTGWNTLTLQSWVDFSGGDSTYCDAAASRANIISTYDWTIIDGGEDCLGIPVEDHFVTTWKTDNTGTSGNDQITIPLVGGPYSADWDNDGTFDQTGINGPITHTFAGGVGTYTIRLYADTPQIDFGGVDGGDKAKFMSISQWGGGAWASMGGAFAGCANLSLTAIDTPDFTAMTDMGSMFRDISSFNQDIGNWDVSNITNFTHVFAGVTAFNQDISSWDTSSALNMSYMFWDATSFNQDISSWTVTGVTDFSGMFAGASVFNQNISGWNVSGNTLTYGMFYNASTFNQDISGWDLSLVPSLAAMFRGASAFNQDISGWNVSSATSMSSMFRDAVLFDQDISIWDTGSLIDAGQMFDGAVSFDQNLGDWDIGLVELMDGMFTGVTLTQSNYDAILISWSETERMDDVPFDGGNSTYCAGITARDDLITINNWTIVDGGNGCVVPTPTSTPTPTPTIVITPTSTPMLTPTPTPTIISTPTPTGTPVPTVIITPTNTPVSTSIPTPTPIHVYIPYNTSIPTITPTPINDLCDSEIEDCVVISNVNVVLSEDNLEVAIFWDTDVDTIGNIAYFYEEGESIVTKIEPKYTSLNHKEVITNLILNKTYTYVINVTSIDEYTSQYSGTFETISLNLLPETGTCTDITSYHYNSDKKIIEINYATADVLTCSNYIGDGVDSYKRVSTSKSKTEHNMAITSDLGFVTLPIRIICQDNLSIACTQEIVITTDESKPEVQGDTIYLPITINENPVIDISETEVEPNNKVLGSASAARNISLLPIVLMSITSLIVYPTLWRKIGFLWIHRSKKKKVWGVVYDKNKIKPIPFATVRLLRGEDVIAEEVSDLDGRYGIVSTMGKYTLSVSHPKYAIFKSTVILSKSGVITKDLPLQYRFIEGSFREKIFRFIENNSKKINITLMTAGFVYTLVISLLNFHWINHLLLSIYTLQIIINFVIWFKNNKKEWGTVYHSQSKSNIAGLFIRVFSKQEGRQIDVHISDSYGRYRFELTPGEYRILVDGRGYEIDTSNLKESEKFVNPTNQIFLNHIEKGSKVFNYDIPVVN